MATNLLYRRLPFLSAPAAQTRRRLRLLRSEEKVLGGGVCEEIELVYQGG